MLVAVGDIPAQIFEIPPSARRMRRRRLERSFLGQRPGALPWNVLGRRAIISTHNKHADGVGGVERVQGVTYLNSSCSYCRGGGPE
jgi:hypothetical protein